MDPSPLSMELLFERYLGDVFEYVLSRVPNHTEAEDITAEVFTAATEAFDRFRGECSPFTWLVAIARRKISEARRLRERKQRWEPAESELTTDLQETLALLLVADIEQMPEDAMLLNEALEVIRDLLAHLPEAQREVLRLQMEQSLSIREIAKVIGRSEAATNSLLERGRAAIFRQGQHYFGR